MKVSKDPSVQLARLQNLIEKNAKNKDDPDAKLTTTIYTRKAEDGTVHLYKLSQAEDTKLNRAFDRFNLHSASARKEVRAKIINTLKENGIEITADIKKALPNTMKLGNSLMLSNAIAREKYRLNTSAQTTKAINNAPTDTKPFIDALKNELGIMNWGSVKSVGTLFRGKSNGIDSMSDYLAGQFSESTKECASKALKAGTECLKKTKNFDKAMIAAHKAMLASLDDVQFSPKFIALAKELHQAVDTVAQEKLLLSQKTSEADMVTPITQESIKQITVDAKKFMISAMLLRSFTSELTKEMNINNFTLNAIAESVTGKIPPTGFSLVRVNQYVTGLFNKADKSTVISREKKETEQTGLPEYEKFLIDLNQNNLNDFKALNLLEKEIQS